MDRGGETFRRSTVRLLLNLLKKVLRSKKFDFKNSGTEIPPSFPQLAFSNRLAILCDFQRAICSVPELAEKPFLVVLVDN